LVGLRFAIGLPLLFAVIRFKRVPLEFDKREYRALAFGSAIIAVHFVIQAIALRYTSATNTGWIIAVSPLALVVLSFLILREKIGKKEIVGIVVGTIGVLLLISRGEFSNVAWLNSTGDWLVLASAHTWALFTIATRDVSRSRNPMTVTLAVFTPVTLLCLIYALVLKDIRRIAMLPAEPLVALLFLGVLGTLTQWFWQIGIAKIGAAQASIFLYLEPVATMSLAVPLLHEAIGIVTLVGGLLVLAGVWWSQRA
jgi:drug/metabolite transporter (DMT)-like permease